MIELIGKNGSGKTFVANELAKRGHKKIVGYTTRQMRNNEVDKIDYNFITKQQFEHMLYNNEFIDYKMINGNYYGISKKGITSSSIITSGDSKEISKKTGYDIYKVYLDADLRTRYRRMVERNSTENIYERIHSENYSFIDDFQALFINNNDNNMSTIDYIESVINEGTISQSFLKSNKQFIQTKVSNFRIHNYKNPNIMLSVLEYEEYILRYFSLNDFINREELYYKLIKDFLDKLDIQYKQEQGKILVLSNKKIYKLDYKE